MVPGPLQGAARGHQGAGSQCLGGCPLSLPGGGPEPGRPSWLVALGQPDTASGRYHALTSPQPRQHAFPVGPPVGPCRVQGGGQAPRLVPGARGSLPTLLSAAGCAQGQAGLEGSADWAPHLGAAPPSPLSPLGQVGRLGLGGAEPDLCLSPRPALPLLDPVTWLISRPPPSHPQFSSEKLGQEPRCLGGEAPHPV